MAALDKGRMSVAAGASASCGALERAVRYARSGPVRPADRRIPARPAAHRRIAVETDAARLLAWRVADLIDRGAPFATEASIAKLYASETAVRSANNALQVFGGYGYIDEYPVGKYLRDARVMTVYEGTSQIQKLIIGRALTGMSAFV